MSREVVDFLIIGSGAAGMSAAIRAHDLGLKTLVVEKSDVYGGSTAMSGGVCWVGNNPKMATTGVPDSDEEVLTYLTAITKGEVSEERLVTYRDESKRVVRYLEEKGHLTYDPLGLYTDYYPEAPGGKPGGRSMDPRPFDGAELGDAFRNLRMPHPQSQIMGKFGITAAEAHTFLVPGWRMKFTMLWHFLKYFLRYFGRKKYGRDTRLTAGNALIGRLRRTMLDRDIPLWLGTPARDLMRDDTGRVTGAWVERDGVRIEIEATRGVLLAAGGFENNLEMRQKYQPKPTSTDWNAASPDNTGDGIVMGMDAGGAVALMDEAWWTPTTVVPRESLAWVLVVEKSLPGGIFVDKNGRRFTNEAAPYLDVVQGMYAAKDEEDSTIPAFLIFDARFRYNFPVGPLAPGYAVPDSRISRRYRDTFLLKAETLEGLAEILEIAPVTLAETVARFNVNALKGEDPDFGRGISANDRYYGDARVQPNPCLGPISNGPFYAIRVYPGDLGTKGGMQTDPAARVLREDGSTIPGLYAAGNSSAAVMGRSYPGAGGTIGPALTFGFLAAEHAAQLQVSRDEAAPSDEAPSDEAPSDEAPSDEAPSDEAPSDEAPSDAALSGAAPSDP